MESVLERLKITIGKVSAGKAEQIFGAHRAVCRAHAARQNIQAGGSMAKLFCFVHKHFGLKIRKGAVGSIESPPEGFLHQPHR